MTEDLEKTNWMELLKGEFIGWQRGYKVIMFKDTNGNPAYIWYASKSTQACRELEGNEEKYRLYKFKKIPKTDKKGWQLINYVKPVEDFREGIPKPKKIDPSLFLSNDPLKFYYCPKCKTPARHEKQVTITKTYDRNNNLLATSEQENPEYICSYCHERAFLFPDEFMFNYKALELVELAEDLFGGYIKELYEELNGKKFKVKPELLYDIKELYKMLRTKALIMIYKGVNDV